MADIQYGIDPPKDYIPVPVDILEESLVRRFEQIVETYPDRVAVKDDAQTLTYHILNESVNNLAQAILEKAGRGDAAITFLLGHDVSAIIAFLAILKAGRPYLGLHLANPVDRMRKVISNAESPLLVSSYKYRSIADNIFQTGSSGKLLYIEDVRGDLPCGNPGIYVDPDLPFSLIYTSGSTGEPKGIVASHRYETFSIMYLTNCLYFSPSDRISLFTSLSVSAGNPGMLGALLNGGMLCLFDLKKHGPQKALDWIRSEQLTIYRSTPSILRSIFSLAPKDLILPNLRIMTLGGEPVKSTDVEFFKAHTAGHCVLVNNFASSETGTMAHFPVSHQTLVTDEFLPSGYPAPSKEIMLLDEKGQPVKQGEEGEIVVRSRYMSSGYWKQPELTAKKFHADPTDPTLQTYYSGDLGRWRADGVLEFIGRRDTNVKIRGFSVQLEAIDHLLQKMDGIQEAACAAHQPARGGKRIVAYLVPAGSRKASVTVMREALSAQLPDYMVPSVFVWLEALPRTVTGKINRKDLPDPSGARPDLRSEFIAPRNEEEDLIAKIWCDLLQMESVGVEDNFFELGGDSLLALSMILEVEKQTVQTVNQAFFQQPTIAHLVETLGGEKLPQGTGKRTPQGKKKTPQPVVGLSKKSVSNKKPRKGIRRLASKSYWQDGLNLAPIFYKRSLLVRPYDEGNLWLTEWCRQPLVAHGIYQAKYKLFCQFISSLDGCTINPVTAYPAFLIGNVLRGLIDLIPGDYSSGIMDKLGKSNLPYWSSLGALLENSPLSEVDKYFSVSGFEYLERAYQESRGVIILTYHSTMNKLAIAALPRRLGCGPIPTISHRVAAKTSSQWKNSFAKDIPLFARLGLNAGEALEGQRFLAQGKIIQLVNDDDSGAGIRNYPVIVAGRQYSLPTGFAELALNTEAAIVPQYSTILANGHIHTTFLPPLVTEPGNRDTQIERLMAQHAEFLTSCWKAVPESMSWSKIRKHFKRPVSAEAKTISLK